MASIEIKMKDGRFLEFRHVGRPGGSYTKEIFYEGAMAVIKDEYGKRTAIPVADIAEVKEWPTRW